MRSGKEVACGLLSQIHVTRWFVCSRKLGRVTLGAVSSYVINIHLLCNSIASSLAERPFLGRKGVTRGYKDGLQPETLTDGNWLVKQNQPVLKIETKSDTNLRSLYESWFRKALISKSVILWWQAKKGINSELEGANARRVLNIPTKRSLYLMHGSHTSAHLQKKSTCFSSWTSPHSHLSQMLEPPCHLQDSTLKWCARNLNLLKSSTHVCPNPCTSRRG